VIDADSGEALVHTSALRFAIQIDLVPRKSDRLIRPELVAVRIQIPNSAHSVCLSVLSMLASYTGITFKPPLDGLRQLTRVRIATLTYQISKSEFLLLIYRACCLCCSTTISVGECRPNCRYEWDESIRIDYLA